MTRSQGAAEARSLRQSIAYRQILVEGLAAHDPDLTLLLTRISRVQGEDRRTLRPDHVNEQEWALRTRFQGGAQARSDLLQRHDKKGAFALMRRLINMRFAAVVGVAAALLMAGGAFAYFTAAGEGSGTATVGSASTVQLSSTTTGELFPGGEAPVTIKVKNVGKGTQYVGTVSAKSIKTSSEPGCKASWFSIAAVKVEKELAAGEETSVSGALKMENVAESQNACQGQTVTISYESN
jgi:hypothetical protein